jgi:multisubunit Na+/H+ antiporter MnhB subunit
MSDSGNKVLQSKEPISKADIQAKFAELKGGVDTEIANIRGIAIGVGVAVVVTAVLVTFALGRRRGRKLATIIEIRRV